jgi:hypothetical protein
MSEIIELPSDTFSAKQPVSLTFEPQSFPGQTFLLTFFWNDSLERYVIELKHVERDNRRVERSVLCIHRFYRYEGFFSLYFTDPARSVTEITPSNLGEQVLLYVIPGPQGEPVENWDDPPSWAEGTS